MNYTKSDMKLCIHIPHVLTEVQQVNKGMFIHWTGACHWSTGMEHRSGALEWTAFGCLIFYIELKNMYV